jgi:hypothetical protein
LLRPRILKRHGLSDREVDVILEALAANAAIREPELADQKPPDPADAHVWALLCSHPDAALVTGDLALREHPAPGTSVMSPADFADGFDL